MHKAYFITFEGGEGAGKSTQMQKLSMFLHSKNIQHVVTREPGGSPVAEDIRLMLVRGAEDKLDALTEYLLFSAARRHHLLSTIKPALQHGQWVLCDRFFDSSIVYQGIAQGLDIKFMQLVYEQLAGNFKPDLTIVLDCSPQKGLKRAMARHHHENRFEQKELSFHRKIHQGFLEIAQQNPDRCVVVNAERAPEKVFTDIKIAIEQRFLGGSL